MICQKTFSHASTLKIYKVTHNLVCIGGISICFKKYKNWKHPHKLGWRGWFNTVMFSKVQYAQYNKVKGNEIQYNTVHGKHYTVMYYNVIQYHTVHYD